jgi:hypothetical protein
MGSVIIAEANVCMSFTGVRIPKLNKFYSSLTASLPDKALCGLADYIKYIDNGLP